MKTCILCKNTEFISYGDDIFGEVFCKDCYDKYSCLHCKRMNIIISYDNNHNITEIEIKKLHGNVVSKNSILNPLFQPGYKFKLYCKECWDSGETEQNIDEDEDNSSIEPEEDDEESYYSDDEDEEDELNGNLNSYYAGKGKYDLY
jgi:hypothetical protein